MTAFVLALPDAVFGVTDIETDADSTVRARMALGPWLTDSGAAPVTGSLGVIVDDVLGHAINLSAPEPDGWCVSTEIGIDLLVPVPVDGVVHGAARTVHADARSGYARGEVRDGSGTVLAHCHQRGRYIPGGHPGEPTQAVRDAYDVVATQRAAARDLVDLLPGVGVRVEGGLTVTTTAATSNPRGTLHGGVALCLVDLAAGTVVRDHATTTSLRVQYLRPVATDVVVTFVPTVVHRGRTWVIVDVMGVLPDGRPCIRGSVTRE